MDVHRNDYLVERRNVSSFERHEASAQAADKSKRDHFLLKDTKLRRRKHHHVAHLRLLLHANFWVTGTCVTAAQVFPRAGTCLPRECAKRQSRCGCKFVGQAWRATPCEQGYTRRAQVLGKHKADILWSPGIGRAKCVLTFFYLLWPRTPFATWRHGNATCGTRSLQAGSLPATTSRPLPPRGGERLFGGGRGLRRAPKGPRDPP